MIRRIARQTMLLAMVGVLGFVGCDGDDSSPVQPTPPPAVVTPSAAIQTTGDGNITISPSVDPTFCCSIVFPIRIEETGGGTAIWNFFRVSYFLNGVELERSEVGSGIISDAGHRDIAANSVTEASVLLRSNVTDFDDVTISLGFSDTKDGRSIVKMMDLAAFTGIVVNPIPSVIPEGQTATIIETSDQ